jgi:hypothetical protein
MQLLRDNPSRGPFLSNIVLHRFLLLSLWRHGQLLRCPVRQAMTMIKVIIEGGRLHHQSTAKIRRALFSFSLTALWAGTTALDATSLGALQVVGRNPLLVVALGTGRDGWAIGVDLDGLGLLDGLLTRALLLLLELGEVGEHPDVVEGVADADGTGEEEEI